MYVEIPFIGKQTELMKKKISQLTAVSRPDLEIRYVAKPPPSARTLFPTKDLVREKSQYHRKFTFSSKNEWCHNTDTPGIEIPSKNTGAILYNFHAHRCFEVFCEVPPDTLTLSPSL